MDLPESLSRRDVLKAAGGLGAVGVAGAGANAYLGGSDLAETEPADDDEAERLAREFAPDLFFGAREKWYPTDPRRYAEERDGETVVDGFTALDSYTKEFAEAGDPPAPTVFYNVRTYPDSPLSVVQYWFYSVFDQFTTNFHWHDFEVLHVFVDADGDADDPALYVASAHSRAVPNNEFIDPETTRVSIVSEVGSHSSALGVNESQDSFQRFPTEELIADISNELLELVDVPAAYGLPRDEGLALAYAVPELDGEPLYEHERLPNVSREDLVAEDVTVDSFFSLSEPPTSLPKREASTSMSLSAVGDYEYDLLPISEIRHLDDLTGPQLSFDFYVPAFAEDAIASHITTTSLPWTQPRFEHPEADITDPTHRAQLAERYDPISAPTGASLLVGTIRDVTGADDAPDGNGVATADARVEGTALVESDPVAVPTFRGVVAARGLPEGEHRVTVNAPGYAPHAEDVVHEGEQTKAGADGDVPLVANGDARKVRAESGERAARLEIADDFAGRLYDARPPDVGESESESESEGRFGLYVHRKGAYTIDVHDADGNRGAYRVNPSVSDDRAVTIDEIQTGRASLSSFVANVLRETHAQAAAFADGDADGFNEAIADFGPLNGRDFTNESEKNPLASLPAVANATERGPSERVDVGVGVGDEDEDDRNESGPTDGVGPDDESDCETTSTGTPSTPDVDVDGDVVSNTTEADGAASESTATATPEPTGTGTPTGEGAGLDVQVDGALGGLLNALARSTLAAARASARSARGEGARAEQSLRATKNRLEAVRRVAENRGEELPEAVAAIVEKRLPLAETRIEAALSAE